MKINCLICSQLINTEDLHYGMHKKCFTTAFSLEKLENFLDIAPRSQSNEVTPWEDRAINSSFFHGKFRKYSSRLGKQSFILKVQQEGYPELPVTEYVCNQIFKELKIEIPPFHLIRFPESELCFATKNFMPTMPPSTLIHIYHYIKPDMNFDCETLVKIIGEQTGRRPAQERFAYLTLADSLIGNNDRHGRNLGFIQSTKETTLAPFYDNPSALGIEEKSMLGADLQPRGCIFTKSSNEPLLKDYILEWERLGYQNVIDLFRKNLSLSNLKQIIESSLLSEKRKKALSKLVEKRSLDLC